MAHTLILIVEDEPAIAELVAWSLQQGGWDCCAVADVAAAWEFIRVRRPHLLVLDWTLRWESGIDLLLRIRRDGDVADLPVLMLSGNVFEQHKVHGLGSGADDYMTKPFSPRELLARVRALLRRTDYCPAYATLRVANVELDPQNCSVRVDQVRIDIGAAEFRLLLILMSHPGQPFSRQQLRERVYGDSHIDERTVDVHVLRLRKAMRGARHLVKTVRNVGYVLSA